MYTVKGLDYFRKMRYFSFKMSHSLTIAKKLVLATGMACIMGLSARVRLPLFWTPVPITLQTFFVLLSGILLGRSWGGISQAIYVIAGALGVQWFSGGIGGLGVIFGPTGGYLIGFIFAAFFLGYVIDTNIKKRSFLFLFLLILFTNLFFIYIPGLIQLGYYLYMAKGTFPGLYNLFAMGLFPFIPGAILKVFLVSALATAILPEGLNSELLNS